ncbi:MAG: 5'-methylthioadenosine/S-adenosylhomocysteine nucleosidase [Oscillospiraceae bacterium]|nr:5'-methylthioadenosine/S-adenosylhomocysteine nucleosidase [Oscillospiraceae bacterium]
MKLGVLIAFDKEIDLLNLNGREFRLAGCRMCELKIGETDVILALCGIGKANAAACTQVLISSLGVDAILNIGLAGSACHIPIGGAVLITEAAYHDLLPVDFVAEDYPGLTRFPADPRLVNVAESVLSEMGVTFTKGVLATGDQFISDSAVKKDIIERTGCSAVEMEGCAIAHIAAKNDTPFCLVKVISDSAEDEAHDEFIDTLSIADYLETSTGFIRKFAASL